MNVAAMEPGARARGVAEVCARAQAPVRCSACGNADPAAMDTDFAGPGTTRVLCIRLRADGVCCGTAVAEASALDQIERLLETPPGGRLPDSGMGREARELLDGGGA